MQTVCNHYIAQAFTVILPLKCRDENAGMIIQKEKSAQHKVPLLNEIKQ
jgi:hypothetical protein